MKWQTALWNQETAQEFKDALECGDMIGLQELINSIIERSNYYRDNEQDKGPYWNDLRKISALVTAAIQLNPILVGMEMGDYPLDIKFDDIYHEIMYYIHDYLIQIINQEVK